MEASDDVGDVVVVNRAAFVVKAVAVGFHVVEPDVIGTTGAGFREDEHSGGDAGVRLEDAAWHGDDGAQLVVVDEFFADGFVGFRGAKEHAVRNDAGALAAFFEHAQEERKKEQLGFFGVGDGFEVVVDAFSVDGAFEWRIGETDGEGFTELVLLGDTVAVVDVGMADGVQHQVHGRDTQHGAVGVEAGEHGPFEVVPLLAGHAIFVVCAHIVGSGDEKARRATGRITDDVVGRRLEQRDHHFDDVRRSAELAVLTGGGEFAEHVFIEVALHVGGLQVVGVDVLQAGDDFLQHLRRWNEKYGVAHVAGKGGFFFEVAGKGVFRENHFAVGVKIGQLAAAHVFDGREDALIHDVVDITRIEVFEFAPTHGLAHSGWREDFFEGLAGHSLKFFSFQFFFIQRADEHQIS